MGNHKLIDEFENYECQKEEFLLKYIGVLIKSNSVAQIF